MAEPARDPVFRRYLETQRQYDAQLVKLLEGTAADARRRVQTLKVQEGIGAQVRAAQLRVTLGAIHDEMASMWRPGVTDIVLAGSQAAAKAAESAVETLSRVVYASLPDGASEALLRGLQAAGQAHIQTLYSRVPRELAERVYRNGAVANGIIDRLIQEGLAQGLSARELAASVYQFVSPSTPGGASYAAMRLARTEINNAFHEQQKQVGKMPGVRGVKWNLSGSHPKPDICNQYAERDNGLGPGVFRPEDVPSKPHPHCFCYLTYVTLTAAEFKKGLDNGDFDDELRRRIAANGQQVVALKTPEAPKVQMPKVKGITPTQEARIKKALAKQADLVPRSMRLLDEVSVVRPQDIAEFFQHFGPRAIAGYRGSEWRMQFTSRLLGGSSTRDMQASVKGGWWSRRGEKATAFDGSLAHEMGHHLYQVIRTGGREPKAIFDAIARHAGIRNPTHYDMASLDVWVSLHQEELTAAVSRYGASNAEELMGEVWAEYSLNPDAREGIKTVGQLIRDAAEESAGVGL